ncbi:glycoside hydrolase family 88 protein [Microbacterium sp. SLBN-154]|uniref:glycoside hydrolase family 88 protein n=1 Tax=Microbacterium sp. SLBN-154 TaxID=2768458 RepID=UPI00135968EF|nr:glycoside hydrolase family 88 protein [Microbacterium sp. SLBN-154]
MAWGAHAYDAEIDSRKWLQRSQKSGPPEPALLDESFARGLAEGITRLPFATWNFGDSVAFEALVSWADFSDEERWASFVHGWGRAWETRSRPFVRLDATVPGSALVSVAKRYGDPRLIDGLAELATYLMSRPLIDGVYELWESAPLITPYGDADMRDRDRRLLASPPPCICVDSLHFDPPFLMALGNALRDDHLIAAALQQARGFVSLLQGANGLFHHFLLRGEEGLFGPGWGRGQGWALLGLLDVIGTHPGGADAEELALLVASVQRLIGAMIRCQRADGHWPVVLTQPDSGDEYSTTAFMITGFLRAARSGIVGHDLVAEAVGKAAQALSRSFDADGSLRLVSSAVYTSTVDDHYAHVPRGFVVPWGQGPALLAVIELLREGR